MNSQVLVYTSLGFLVLVKNFNARGNRNKQEKIVLYHLEYCPFCQKVTKKLDELELKYILKDISKSKYKKELSKKRDGITTVPYIEVDGDGMGESDDIVEMLEERFGDANNE